MTRAEWVDALGREHVLEVAKALGLETRAPRGASGGSCACPACAAVRRHPSRHDRRLAIGVRREGRGWRCYECDAHGDQLHLVAIALEGRRWNELGSEPKARVRAWVMEWLRIGQPPSSTPTPKRMELRDADAPPEYPPQAEVLALWEHAIPVRRDERAVRWLGDRGLSALRIAQLDLCRVLPWGLPCPAWAGRPALEATEDKPAVEARPWSRSAYRCVFPMFDAHGVMRSLLARYVGKPPTPQAEPRAHKRAALKSRAPHGFERRGLVLACPRAERLLRGERLEQPARVVVAEGEMDLCAWSTATKVVPGEVLVVLGVFAGGWTSEHAARIPDGSTVVIATHHDQGGEAYARQVSESLSARREAGAITMKRWRP